MTKFELENKLSALKIAGRVAGYNENDFYKCYSIIFNQNVTLSKIKSRAADIGLFCGGVAEIEPDETTGAVIIKVLKKDRGAVGIFDFTEDINSGKLSDYKIPLIIGQSENGTRLYYDLVKCPHLLAAGATGSGKSVFMHNCIVSAIYSGICNIVLIDVKRVEFNIYEGIPHLCHNIAYNPRAAFITLKDVNAEMVRRYQILKENKCRNIEEYRQNGGKLNYITVFIDELADLLLDDRRIESQLIKIAQLGRAAGIHLIVATQRPDSTIISGLIRVNIPSRVCFAVQKSADSRIILDQTGGENLRGAGDGLFLPIGQKKPLRFQAPYISTAALDDFIETARRVND